MFVFWVWLGLLAGSRRLLFLNCVERVCFSLRLPYSVEWCNDVSSDQYDVVVAITNSLAKLAGPLQLFGEALQRRKQIDAQVEKDVSVLEVEGLPSRCLIFSPTGPINRDQDDVRCFSEAAEKGVERAIKAGHQKPLLVRAPDDCFPNVDLVTILGALRAAYVPLEAREAKNAKDSKIEKLGIWGANEVEVLQNIKLAVAIENGRFVCRDIGGSDPERMAAPRVEEYVQELFKETSIDLEVIESMDRLEKEYPLLSAVNRAAKDVERHRARVIHLTYAGEGPIDTTLMLVGKGVTYDTGGADLKVGGAMSGMHRDKCGAAAVAGFFQVLSILKPKGIKVVGAMAMVRNSIGSESYVSDEIITSRCGLRVRIGNTDAEGRMAMGDVLCQMREKAVNEVNPHLMTIATLTGHACLAVGDYSIVIDNGPARKENCAGQLQEAADAIGDPFEVSTFRREDYNMNAAKNEYEDIVQCNSLPSSRTPRGHQFPGAFLIQVSGLDLHGGDSDTPIKYSHLDIAGSAGDYPGIPTGAPVAALSARYLLKRI